MSILAGLGTRVVFQGLRGTVGEADARRMVAAGTRLVAGVTEGAGGSEFEGVPLFETVAEAVAETGATASFVSASSGDAADGILEAADAGIDLIVGSTEWLPLLDRVDILRHLAAGRARLVGPGSAGIVTPGECLIGSLQGESFAAGRVGQAGTFRGLLMEGGQQLAASGLGTSTAVDLGRGPIRGLSLSEAVVLLRADPDTEAILVTGTVDPHEVDALSRAVASTGKPIAAYLPVTGGGDSAAQVRSRLSAAGCAMIDDPEAIGRTVADIL